MDENEEKKDQKIEIIEGDSKDLEISDVKDNLAFEIKPEQEKKQNIIIPKNQ